MWAVLSDVHGNLAALEAVVKDARLAGAKHWIIAGDLCAFGPDPLRCLDYLIRIPGVTFVQGNTDRYLVQGVWLFKQPENERQAAMLDHLRWTADEIGNEGVELLARMPDEQRFLDALVVHASPGHDEVGILATQSEDQWRQFLGLAKGARTLIGGHTHLPFLRELPEGRLINLGSVGFPFDGLTEPSYLLTDGQSWEIRRVRYDLNLTDARIRASGMPFADEARDRLFKARP